MIVITVELWPGGDPEERMLLGTGIIGNDGTGSITRGNYNVALGKRRQALARVWERPWRRVRVEDFPRQQLGHWDLLYRALRNAVGDRNKETG